MPTVIISAMPGHYEQHPGRSYTSIVIEMLGENLGRTKAEVKSLADITAATKALGADVTARHPGRSFYISVGMEKGSRKPRGFDAADRSRAFGQEGWMQTRAEGNADVTNADPPLAA